MVTKRVIINLFVLQMLLKYIMSKDTKVNKKTFLVHIEIIFLLILGPFSLKL